MSQAKSNINEKDEERESEALSQRSMAIVLATLRFVVVHVVVLSHQHS